MIVQNPQGASDVALWYQSYHSDLNLKFMIVYQILRHSEGRVHSKWRAVSYSSSSLPLLRTSFPTPRINPYNSIKLFSFEFKPISQPGPDFLHRSFHGCSRSPLVNGLNDYKQFINLQVLNIDRWYLTKFASPNR